MNSKENKTETSRSLRPFYKHQWLDVLDDEGQWLEAQITDIGLFKTTTNTSGVPDTLQLGIHIHFKGWNHKYDEWLNLEQCQNPYSETSQRLAPYCSKSVDWKTFAVQGWLPSLENSTVDNGIVSSEFEIGDAIDVLDTTSVWLSASIEEIQDFGDGPMIRVHYTGWSPQYDEWIPIESYRLAPFRTHTIDYRL